jgi:hypothetical protein
MAFSLRLTPPDMQQRIDDLILLGLIDILPDGSLVPHNWDRRQWKSDESAERVKKHREIKKQRGNDKCNSDVTVTVTPPDSDSEPDTESNLLPPEQDAARESEKSLKFDLGGVGAGSQAQRSISPAAKRKACERLGLRSADKLASAFLGWRGSARAKDLDAMFLGSIEKIFGNLPPSERAGMLVEPIPDLIVKPVRPSASLASSKLIRGSRHDH